MSCAGTSSTTTTATPPRSGGARPPARSSSIASTPCPATAEEKAQIFVAILAKRMSVAPPGWQQAAGPFADAEPRSVADIDSPASLEKVREWKRAMKAAKKDKQGRELKS